MPSRCATAGDTPAVVALGRTGTVPIAGRAPARRAADTGRACAATGCEPLMTDRRTAVSACWFAYALIVVFSVAILSLVRISRTKGALIL
jgi:hypothetical protein